MVGRLNWMSWVYPWDTDDNRVFLAEDIEENNIKL